MPSGCVYSNTAPAKDDNHNVFPTDVCIKREFEPRVTLLRELALALALALVSIIIHYRKLASAIELMYGMVQYNTKHVKIQLRLSSPKIK